MSVLLATLRMAGGLEEFDFTSSGSGVSSWEYEQLPTVVGMRDGNDATGGYARAQGDGATPDTSNWTFGATLDELGLGAGQSIDFVRVRIRAKRVGSAGTATVQPAMNATAVGSPVAVVPAPGWIEQDFETDPLDAAPWTATKINSRKWGWYSHTVTSTPFSQTENWQTEMAVEAWGTELVVEEVHEATLRAGTRSVRVKADR
jgi:hypothetical protein